MKCQLLMTGNELMTGVTVDSNAAWIAEQLLSMGIGVHKKVTVGDCLADLEREIDAASRDHDLLIINGGLGPTVDDLTAQALANVCQQPLHNHAEAEIHVRQWCARRGIHANAANLKQARLPAGAAIIANTLGSAVGIRLQHRRCQILCTPGVPKEMQEMLQQEILPWLQKQFPGCEQSLIKRLQVFGMGESAIQQKIHDNLGEWPDEVALGFRAGFPTLEVKLTVHHREHLPQRDLWEHKLRDLLGSVIFGENNDSLASVVIAALQQQQRYLTTAESCTGGLIAATLTGIAGASRVFEAGFVTYSNAIKQQLLDVQPNTLQQHGAVSEAVVREMLAGALQKSGAYYGLAVSGIAGPEGGTAEKPVGSVWIAWGSKEKIRAQSWCYPAERKTFQTLVSAYGLDLIRREILQITDTPRYFSRGQTPANNADPAKG